MEDLSETERSRAVTGYFRGRTSWRRWKPVLVSCLFHRKFHLALEILMHLLHHVTVSQDIWVWRVLFVVLANVDASEDLCRQFFRMLQYTKTPDYDERRLCYFFFLHSSGRTQMAVEFVEKDMPPKMRSSLKRATPAQNVYESQCRAMQQMWRATTTFWKRDMIEDVPRYVFRMLPYRTGEGGTTVMETVGGSATKAVKKGKTVEQDNDEGIPGDATEVLLKRPGDAITQSFDLERFIELFEVLLSTTGPADNLMFQFIQTLENAKEFSCLEGLLLKYRDRYPDNPLAHKFLLEYYVRHHAEDTALRLPVLKSLCDLVPYGSHVTRYSDEVTVEGDDDTTVSVLRLLFPALACECHRHDAVCWSKLALIVRTALDDGSGDIWHALRESWLDLKSWWGKWHFSVVCTEDQEVPHLLFSKVQVCTAFFGQEHGFVGTGSQLLSEKRTRKLTKYRSRLLNVFQKLSESDDIPLLLPVKNPWMPGDKNDEPDEQGSGESVKKSAKRKRKTPKKSSDENMPGGIIETPRTHGKSRSGRLTRSSSRKARDAAVEASPEQEVLTMEL